MLSRNLEKEMKISHGECHFQTFKSEILKQFTRKAMSLADFQVRNQKSIKKTRVQKSVKEKIPGQCLFRHNQVNQEDGNNKFTFDFILCLDNIR